MLAAILISSVIALLCVLEKTSRWWEGSNIQFMIYGIPATLVLTWLIEIVRKTLVNIIYSLS